MELRRRRVHSSKPSSGAPAEIVRYDFKGAPSTFRARQSPSLTLPKLAGKSNFSRSMAILSGTKTSCRHDVSCPK